MQHVLYSPWLKHHLISCDDVSNLRTLWLVYYFSKKNHNPYRQEQFLSFALSVVHNKHTIVTYKTYNTISHFCQIQFISSQISRRDEKWHISFFLKPSIRWVVAYIQPIMILSHLDPSLIKWSSIHDTHHKSHSLEGMD